MGWELEWIFLMDCRFWVFFRRLVSIFTSYYFNKYFTRFILICNILYLSDLEDVSKDLEQSITTASNYIKFSVWVSFFEIYNECFYDLLVPISNDKKRKTLRLAQDIKGCSFVKGEWNILEIAKCNLKSWSTCKD